MKKNQPPSKFESRRQEPKLSRRDLLKSAVGAGAVAALSGCARDQRRALGASCGGLPPVLSTDQIRKENERPGTRDWMLQNTRIDPATKYRCPWIEGYASRTSLRAGESIDFFVSSLS